VPGPEEEVAVEGAAHGKADPGDEGAILLQQQRPERLHGRSVRCRRCGAGRRDRQESQRLYGRSRGDHALGDATTQGQQRDVPVLVAAVPSALPVAWRDSTMLVMPIAM
jgi:hypothetical protein